jgi:hypothetical protein
VIAAIVVYIRSVLKPNATMTRLQIHFPGKTKRLTKAKNLKGNRPSLGKSRMHSTERNSDKIAGEPKLYIRESFEEKRNDIYTLGEEERKVAKKKYLFCARLEPVECADKVFAPILMLLTAVW